MKSELYKFDERLILDKKFVAMEKKINSWQEAIYRVSEPLLKEKIIEKSYVQAMIDNVLNYGDYMVIVPNVVI